MRHSRIKIPPTESAAAYHCISRTVNGEWLFDDVAKEIFRKQLWRVADYCGLSKNLTYSQRVWEIKDSSNSTGCFPTAEVATHGRL
jgi:hypothetical protein